MNLSITVVLMNIVRVVAATKAVAERGPELATFGAVGVGMMALGLVRLRRKRE
jgi:hypothetical protein